MGDDKAVLAAHPAGEAVTTDNQAAETITAVDTFAGKVQVKWSPEAEVSSLGLMPFFIEFLKTSGLFDNWVDDCPLAYTSPNAPAKRDVLGTILLSVLAGHWRYAHINAIRGDGINPGLLGMSKVASEDSVRRAMAAIPEQEGQKWLQKHLKASYEPLLEEPWAFRPGHYCETAVRAPRRRPDRIQSAKARAAVACLSQLLHCQSADGDGCGSAGRQSDRVVVRAAAVVGVAGRMGEDEPSHISAG